MHRLALLSAAVVAMPVGLAAQEIRQLDAHMHGESALNIAIEGNAVAMELEAPAMDIVGFEHEPSTDEHRAQIEAAIKSLSAPLDVFVFPEGAGCAVSNASVEHVFGEDHDDHDDHGAAEAHDEHHGEDEAGHESAEHHDDEHEGEAVHSGFRAVYELACADPGAIDAVDFAFFSLFPMAEAVEVQIITEQGQAAFEVERGEPRLDLGEVLG